MPGLLVYELAWLVFTLLQGHLRAHLRGKVACFRELGPVLRERRELQAKRKVADRDLLVAGPLTFSPSLVESPAKRRLAGALDFVVSLWWKLARPLSG